MSAVAEPPPPNHSEARYMIAYVKNLCDNASKNTVIKTSRWRNSFDRRGCIIYEVVSKIFRTDAVKIIKLTMRPVGHRHP